MESSARTRKSQQIAEAGLAVFLAQGFSGASVDDIAAKADVSKATLYKYFPTKEQLFEQVVREACGRYAQQIKLPDLSSHNARDAVLTLAGMIVRLSSSPELVGLFRLCMAEARRFPAVARAFYDSGPQLAVSRTAQVLTRLCQDGMLSIDNAERAARQLGELCKAEVFEPLIFGQRESFSEAELNRHARIAAETFLRAYSAASS